VQAYHTKVSTRICPHCNTARPAAECSAAGLNARAAIVGLEPADGLGDGIVDIRELEARQVLAQLGVGSRLFELPVRLGRVEAHFALRSRSGGFVPLHDRERRGHCRLITRLGRLCWHSAGEQD